MDFKHADGEQKGEDTRYDDAVDLESTGRLAEAIKLFETIVEDASGSAKQKEMSIYKLGELYAKEARADDVRKLMVKIRPFFASIPKAKTAKIVRTLIDLVGKIPDCTGLQAELCKESIEWCVAEQRTFLKQRIEARLCDLYLKLKQYKDALALISRLVREVKKIDDKLLLVEIHLVESRVHHSLENMPKAKGALTSARSAANSIYCPPKLQAEIDLQAGTLCAEEKDYKTSFSYFYEAFEGYTTINKPEVAVRCLKYMLLAKMMTDSPSDVYAIINGKAGVKHAGVEIEAMRAIADAHKERSIQRFEEVLKKYKAQLVDDPIIHAHLNQLYERLLEGNLIRIIEPFSRVEIAHVAKLIKLPLPQVESKLSEMILDKKFSGTLDQGAGVLVVFDEIESDKTFDASLDTIKELNNVVDKLYEKARTIQ